MPSPQCTPERTIAACADVVFAKPDLYRKTLFRVWRRMVDCMPWDDFSDHVTSQAVGARFMESPEGAQIFELVRLVKPFRVTDARVSTESAYRGRGVTPDRFT